MARFREDCAIVERGPQAEDAQNRALLVKDFRRCSDLGSVFNLLKRRVGKIGCFKGAHCSG